MIEELFMRRRWVLSMSIAGFTTILIASDNDLMMSFIAFIALIGSAASFLWLVNRIPPAEWQVLDKVWQALALDKVWQVLEAVWKALCKIWEVICNITIILICVAILYIILSVPALAIIALVMMLVLLAH